MKLRHSRKLLKQLGKSAIEYGLVLAAVVTIVMAGATAMDDEFQDTFETAAESIKAFATDGDANNTGTGGD